MAEVKIKLYGIITSKNEQIADKFITFLAENEAVFVGSFSQSGTDYVDFEEVVDQPNV